MQGVAPSHYWAASYGTGKPTIWVGEALSSLMLAAMNQRREATLSWVVGPGLVAVVAVWQAISGFRGSDYPAHVFRAWLWARNPSGTWNFQWYGGHSTLAYTVIEPPVAAWVTPFGVAALSSVGAACLVVVLARRWFSGGALIAVSLAFGAAAAASELIGQVPYSAGLLLALVVLAAWARGWVAVAALVAPLVAFTSPVASVLLGIACASVLVVAAADAVRLGSSRWRAVAPLVIGVATGLPLVLMMLVARRGASAGSDPYSGYTLLSSLVVSVVVAGLAGGSSTRNRTVRAAAVIGTFAAIVLAIVPNPLGGNFVRFAVCLLVIGSGLLVERAQSVNAWSNRRVAVMGALVVVWMYALVAFGQFAVRDVARWFRDPSVHEAYFAPLIAEVQRRQADQPLARLEIPFTRLHWEASAVAPHVALARGWERQVDVFRNGVLYDPELDATEYRRWLDTWAVGFVAVPDVPLDDGGTPERQLIGDGSAIDWLSPVWSNEHWTLFAVMDPQPLASGSARVTSIDARGVTLVADAPGTIDLQLAYDPRLGIEPAGCLTVDADEQVVARVPEPGTYRIVERPWGFVTAPPPCR